MSHTRTHSISFACVSSLEAPLCRRMNCKRKGFSKPQMHNTCCYVSFSARKHSAIQAGTFRTSLTYSERNQTNSQLSQPPRGPVFTTFLTLAEQRSDITPVDFDTVIFLPFNLTTSFIPDIQKHRFKSWASLSFQARQFPFCLINKEIKTWKKVKGVRNLRP